MVTRRTAQSGLFSAALLIAVRLLLVAISIVSLATPGVAAEKVVLQLIWDHQFQFAGFYAAKWQGFYAAAGLDVEIRPGLRPDRSIVPAMKELRAGRVDFTLASANALIERDRGEPISVLATIFQQSPVAFYYRADAGHISPADLINLRVARRIGGIADAELQSMLRVEGIDPGLVKPMRQEPGIVHLAERRVDVAPGYTLATPWIARKLGLKVRTIRPQDHGIDFYGDTLVTHQRVIDRDPDLVRRFVAASLKGWKYALDNSEQIARRIATDLPRTVPVGDLIAFNRFQAEEVRKLMLYPHVNPGHMNAHRWQRMHDYLKQAGLVTNRFDLENFIFDPEQESREQHAFLLNAAIATAAALALLVVAFVGWTRMLRRGVARATAEIGQMHHDLQHAYSTIEESEVSLANAQRIAHLGNWDWNIETGALHWSDEIYRIFGRTPQEFPATYEAFLETVHPDDRATVETAVQDAISKRTPYAIDHRICLSDGSIRTVHEQGAAEFDADGRAVRMTGTVQDITGRKRAEDALRESEKQFRNLIETSPDAAFVDCDGKIVFANNAAVEMFAAESMEQLIGRQALDFIHPGDHASVSARRQSLAQGRQVNPPLERRGVRLDGSEFYGEARAVRFTWGGKIAFLVVIRDVTERKRVEEKIRNLNEELEERVEKRTAQLGASEERYRKLIEVSQDAIFVRQDEQFVYANAAAAELFRASSPEDIVGRNWLDYAPPTNRGNARKKFLNVAKHAQTQPASERRFLRMDGSEIEVETSATPIAWDGRPAVLSVVRDITERKKAERKLAAVQVELVKNERLATLGQLTATVSHELRNPLGAMRTSIYMLRNHMPSSDARLVRAAERIDRNITRCDSIIDELLDFARIRDLEFTTTALDDWLGAVLDEQAVPDGIEIRHDPGASGISVPFDADRLRRAVINVYDNACQAMAEPTAGGNAGRGDGVLAVTTRIAGDRAEISFRDTGPGIPEELREKIFEPLFSTKGFGVGLGLCVVRQILEQHGGGVEITSDDSGTEVVLWLPHRHYSEVAV